MNKKFTKDDLHSGYVVEFRNGIRLLVARVNNKNFTKILTGPGVWFYLGSGWDSDLRAVQCPPNLGAMSKRVYKTSLCEWDIVKVYGLLSGSDTALYGYVFNTSDAEVMRPLLWERKEAVKMTVAEICAKLGYDVEIVAET